jgi:hypothetical protein
VHVNESRQVVAEVADRGIVEPGSAQAGVQPFPCGSVQAILRRCSKADVRICKRLTCKDGDTGWYGNRTLRYGFP